MYQLFSSFLTSQSGEAVKETGGKAREDLSNQTVYNWKIDFERIKKKRKYKTKAIIEDFSLSDGVKNDKL